MDKATEIKVALNSYIIETLNSGNFRDNLKVVIKEELITAILLKKDELIKVEPYKNIKSKLKRDILDTTKQQGFKESINKFIDENLKSLEKSNQSLGSIVPPVFVNSLKVYVYNHSDDISSTLKSLLNSENVIKKLNTEVINIMNGLNPMISRFINASTIQTKLISGINDYLSDPKNMIDLVNMINSMLDNLMKKKVSEFSTYFPTEGRKSLINSISSGIITNIFSEKFIDMALLKFEEIIKAQLNSLNEKSEGLNKELDSLVDNFINNSYEALLESPKLKELVELLSLNLVDNLLNKPLIDLINN